MKFNAERRGTRFFLGRKNQRTFGLMGSMGVLQVGMVQLELQVILSLLT